MPCPQCGFRGCSEANEAEMLTAMDVEAPEDLDDEGRSSDPEDYCICNSCGYFTSVDQWEFG